MQLRSSSSESRRDTFKSEAAAKGDRKSSLKQVSPLLLHRKMARGRRPAEATGELPEAAAARDYLLRDTQQQRAKKRKEVRFRRQAMFIAALVCCYLLLGLSRAVAAAEGRLPELSSGSSEEPLVAIVGQDAFLSCLAKNLQNYTIIWRYSNEANAPAAAEQPEGEEKPASGPERELGVILSAGRQRVLADERFSVIQSHDTWLLKISNVRLSDTGTYICQTNSEPRVRAIRILNVVKPNAGQDADSIDYNFTDCCRADLVSSRCQQLCSFQQLASRYQSINIVHECYSYLPSVTRCMVAGRNVTDCCQRRHIPGRCKSMCGHSGDTSQMSVKDQSYCADYSAAIMSCVADGLSTLPAQPELVIVEAVSSSTLKVYWQKVTDESELAKIDGWIINLTKLSSFEESLSGVGKNGSRSKSEAGSGQLSATSPANLGAAEVKPEPQVSATLGSQAQTAPPLASLNIVDVMNNSSLAAMTKLLSASSATLSLKLDKSLSEFTIKELKPYTVYQIQMFAYNSLGRSQLTDPIRALTLAPEAAESSQQPGQQEAYVEPNLPDTRKCCLERGVTLKRCLDTLCDPVAADGATIADLMICAPWSNITFGCLSSRVDHTNCCKSRGVSPFCLAMCSGEIKRVDYRHFRCLTHMSTYTNCILESHNVLPSAPLAFSVGPITHAWAVLNWSPPKKNARSLQGYRIFWRRLEGALEQSAGSNATSAAPSSLSAGDEFYYSSAEAATNPYLLDALQPETVYETFVVAVNKFGQSESSVRLLFQTLIEPDKLAASSSAGVAGAEKPDGSLESRLPLHGGAGSLSQSYYNETACCQNGGVSSSCIHLCDYEIRVGDVASLVSNCNREMPAILRCMAGSRNSVPCCRARSVSENCLNVCAGLTEHSPLLVATRCAADFGKIVSCMDDGSKQIPAAPVDLHTLELRPEAIRIAWAPASEDALRRDIQYHVRYQQLQQPADQSLSTSDLSSLIAVVPVHPLEHNLLLTTNNTQATIDRLSPNQRYSVYVTAENSYGISLPSLVLVVQTPPSSEQQAPEEFQRKATLGAPHSLEILRSDTESIVLKWIAPLFINSEAQIKYRVFYKLFASPNDTSESPSGSGQAPEAPAGNNEPGAQTVQLSNNWTVVETADTSILLKDLRYSSQYVITVQAYSKELLGHMSEILLASTAKPVPPTLNNPLVIHKPVEGNNITIMCVALGQPTPQISMFINGLLVQKRTKPYVIYHLVNLVRGHLTITCFASNGHGKDYASVQSRTELSVMFPAKATAKSKEVRANQQSTGRLTCELTGNPQPSIVWTLTPAGAPESQAKVIEPSEKVSSLLFGQFDNPFTWSHTLTLRNLSEADVGLYSCRARNKLGDSTDSIRLTMLRDNDSGRGSDSPEAGNQTASSNVAQLEQNSDLMDCCRSQKVGAKCLPVCSVDGLDIEGAFKTPECEAHLDKLMFCAADGSDHRNCCRNKQVPSSCLRWCSGARLNIPAYCFLASAIDINQCFQEGKSLLPGPPRNIRVMLASQSSHNNDDRDSQPILTTTTSAAFTGNSFNNSVIHSMVMMMAEQPATNANEQSAAEESSAAGASGSSGSPASNMPEPLVIEWEPPAKNPQLVQYYRIFWRPFGSRELSRMVTNLTWIKLNDLNANKIYEFVVKAANSHGSSVYSDPLTVRPAEIMAQAAAATSGGLIWFMPSGGGSLSLWSRIALSVSFASLFMFCSLGLVLLLERRGYLKGFASSKSNSSRISFANPAYSKESDAEQVQWDAGHSLDILGPPPEPTSGKASPSGH